MEVKLKEVIEVIEIKWILYYNIVILKCVNYYFVVNGVKNIIVVIFGKGGVGKFIILVNLVLVLKV